MSYAELHCHSVFSLLEGAAQPEQLVTRAVELGMRSLALTDRDDLGGAVRFATAAKTAGLAGILGAELTVEVRGAAPGAGCRAQVLSAGSGRGAAVVHRLVLLAETREGYGNLSTLITLGRMRAARGAPVSAEPLSLSTVIKSTRER